MPFFLHNQTEAEIEEVLKCMIFLPCTFVCFGIKRPKNRATLDNLKDEMNSHQVDIDRIENEITSFLSNNDKIMQYHRESLTNLVESYSKFRLVKSLICHYQNCMGLCKLMGREKEFTLCQNRIQILEELKLQVPEEIRFLF